MPCGWHAVSPHTDHLSSCKTEGFPDTAAKRAQLTCRSARALATEAVPLNTSTMHVSFQAMSILVSRAFSQNSSDCSRLFSFIATSSLRSDAFCRPCFSGKLPAHICDPQGQPRVTYRMAWSSSQRSQALSLVLL